MHINLSVSLIQPLSVLLLSGWSGLPSDGAIRTGRDGVHIDFLPVLLGIRLRLNDLCRDLHTLLDHQEASIVLVGTVLVSGRSNRHEVIREPFNTSWHDGVRSDHHRHAISLEEGVQVVSTKEDNVVLLLRVSCEVVLEAILVLVFMGIGPEQVNQSLMVLTVISTKLDLSGSLNLLNSLQILNSWSNTSMAAEDLAILANSGGKRHIFEGFVNLGEA